jgi:hypothetical protein
MKIWGFLRSSKNKADYPNIPSVMKPVPHREDLPIPLPPTNWRELPIFEEEGCMESSSTSADPSYIHRVFMNHTKLSKWSLMT